jgi:predicted enzyme related to lactoylglutathione lyase
MPSAIQPVLVTPDLDRLRTFYSTLLGAVEVQRFPAEGPAFYVGLQVDGADLGLTADAAVPTGAPGRVLLSIDVPDVDALLPLVAGLGGSAPGPATDMPWGRRVAHISDPDGNAVNLTQQL